MSIYREFHAYPGPSESVSRARFFAEFQQRIAACEDPRWQLKLEIGEEEHDNKRSRVIHLAYLKWKLEPKTNSNFESVYATVGASVDHGRGAYYYLIVPNSIGVYSINRYEPDSDDEHQVLAVNDAVLSACVALFETCKADILIGDVDTWDGCMTASEATTQLPGCFSLLRVGTIPDLENRLERLSFACDPRGPSFAIGDRFIRFQCGPTPVGQPSYRVTKWGTGLDYDYDEELIDTCKSFQQAFREMINELLPGWDADVPRFTVDGEPG